MNKKQEQQILQFREIMSYDQMELENYYFIEPCIYSYKMWRYN